MVFGSYWVVLEPKFWEEVGDEKLTSQLYNQGMFEAIEGHSEQNYAEEKPSQSHFEAEKLLRRRRCWTISGSFGRPFCMSFSLHGSRDLEEHDQINIVAIWHFRNVIFSF
jgi:hypothetical protein